MSAADNLRDNLDQIVHNTYFNTDKVVNTYSGTFQYGTNTTTRNYTLAGFANNQQAFRIAHPFTRPVFTELLWSLDGSNYVVGGIGYDGSGNYCISYSDSDYIYIMPTTMAAGTTVHYKLVASWIDDYDDTNPSVDAFTNYRTGYTQILTTFATTPSIVKQGVITCSTSSAFITDVVATEPHNLGWAPEYVAFVESFAGEVWPLTYGGTANPYLVDDSQVEGQLFVNTTNAVANLSMKASNGDRRLWYYLYGKRSDYIGGRYGSVQSAI